MGGQLFRSYVYRGFITSDIIMILNDGTTEESNFT